MPYPVFNNLRIRFGAIVLLAMLPAIGLMIFNSIEQRRMVTQHAQQQAQMLLLHAIQDQEQLVDGARQMLTTLAHLPQLQTGGWENCGAFFSGLIQEYPQYANVGMAAANGDLLCSAVMPLAPVNYADLQWFQDVLARRSFTVGEYIIGRVTGVALLPFAYPVLGEHGEITLVLRGGIDLRWLNALAARAELPEGTVLSVMDQNGTVLARSLSPEDYVGKAFPEAAIIKAVRERSAGTAEIPGLDGVTRLYAYAPLSSQTSGNTFIAIGIPVETAYAEGMRVLTRNLII
ncbi:MAG: cache domain-containing protein, partial [Anaerolineaceae bacterium]|nr:cache domain-containing protein [Anaerolineaceae bacterium]